MNNLVYIMEPPYKYMGICKPEDWIPSSYDKMAEQLEKGKKSQVKT